MPPTDLENHNNLNAKSGFLQAILQSATLCGPPLNLKAPPCDQQWEETAEAAVQRGVPMTKTIFGSISAIAFAAAIAGGITILPTFSNPVVASAPIHSGKGDRLDIRPIGAQCSEQAWPYFEAGCLRDRRAVLGKTKPARIVTADRF